MKTLFINPISSDITISLLEDSICRETHIIPKWDDFSQFPEKVIELVDAHSIKEIWCICGPGAFTRMRIVTLTLTTLRLSRAIRLKWCHFFSIIKEWIPILRANDREYIIETAKWITTLIEKGNIPLGTYIWYDDKNDFTDAKVFIEYREDAREVSRVFEQIEYTEVLSPIYLKDPHITCSKKNTSPF